MSKRALTLKVRIPPYRGPRNSWRRDIHEAVRKQQLERQIEFLESDRLEVSIRLYLDYHALSIHDLDNRLKDILDALQGRAGGSKKIRSLTPIIPNDNQICKVSIEKCLPPKQSHGIGHLTIRKYSA